MNDNRSAIMPIDDASRQRSAVYLLTMLGCLIDDGERGERLHDVLDALRARGITFRTLPWMTAGELP